MTDKPPYPPSAERGLWTAEGHYSRSLTVDPSGRLLTASTAVVSLAAAHTHAGQVEVSEADMTLFVPACALSQSSITVLTY